MKSVTGGMGNAHLTSPHLPVGFALRTMCNCSVLCPWFIWDVNSNTITALTAGYGTQEYAARVVAGMQHQSQACSKAYSIWQRQHLRRLTEPAADTAAPAPHEFQPLLSCLTGKPSSSGTLEYSVRDSIL